MHIHPVCRKIDRAVSVTIIKLMRALQFWDAYKIKVSNNLIEIHQSRSVNYWRDLLFTDIVIYAIPLSLIALVPGVPIAWSLQMYGMLLADFLSFGILVLIALSGSISIRTRKILFLIALYNIALVMLCYLGSFGPSLIYMLGATVLSAIILNKSVVWVTVVINIATIIIYAILLTAGVLDHTEYIFEHNVAAWIGVSSNLIFLSIIFAILIPRLLDGMQSTINENLALQDKLIEEGEKLKKSMTKLNDKNLDLEQYAYVTSHDLQEPLRMITGFLKQLESKYRDVLDEKAKRYIFFALDGTSRMRKIIVDLLEYSRIGNYPEARETIDIKQVIEDEWAMHQRVIEEKNARIDIQELPIVIGNRTPFVQIFRNLISNSLRFTQKNRPPFIQIRLFDEGTFWLIEFQDNGIGIPDDKIEQSFVMFRQFHDGGSGQGTGIGLPIVKKAIESLGGTVSLESKLNDGTIFKLRFPKELKIHQN